MLVFPCLAILVQISSWFFPSAFDGNLTDFVPSSGKQQFSKKKLMILVIRASCISAAYFGISAEMPLIEAALEPFRFKIILYKIICYLLKRRFFINPNVSFNSFNTWGIIENFKHILQNIYITCIVSFQF